MTMARIQIDYENAAEAWWDAARQVASGCRNPTFTRLFNKLQNAQHEIECSVSEAEEFLDVAKRLDGWADGPTYALNPVRVLW